MAATCFVCASAAPRRVADHDDIDETDVVVDHRTIGEGGERPSLDAPRYADAKDEILLAQPPILDQCREHQLRAGEILTVGDARAIVAPETGVERQNARLWVARPPLRPRGQDHRQRFELDLEASQATHHRTTGELLPQRVGLSVKHQFVGAIEQAGGAESESFLPAGHAVVEQDPRAAQGAVSEADRNTADYVVD